MIVLNSIENIQIDASVVALGKFDGVHLGHQKILEEMKKELAPGTKLVVITFSVSPEAVLTRKHLKYLMTEQEKQDFFEKQGIDYLIDVELGTEFLAVEAEDFIQNYLVGKLGVKKIVCGTDFGFGKGRRGNVELLREYESVYGYTASIVDKVKRNGEIISSTAIRQAISSADMKKAADMLGRPYRVTGMVCHGKELGRTIQFPTLNLYPTEEKLLPLNGVYQSRTYLEGKCYESITNVGINPTVEHGNVRKVETNLFNFSGDAYQKYMEVELLDFIRPERKFSSVSELKEQIARDVLQVKKSFGR